MIPISDLLQYYKRPEICSAIVEHALDKEVAVKFGDKGFGKRPDTLQYPNDVLELAKMGCTSFHSSEELWSNPLLISPTLKRRELDNIRKGWDLILDIDCAWLKYSKLAADLLIRALEYKGIKNVSVKFSGNHGFHIGVCFESFPQILNDKQTKDLFPEAPRAIAEYLSNLIKNELSKRILAIDPLDKIIGLSKKPFDEIVIDGRFNPFKILDIDTILISSRHLYRMPYSFNEKSGLISIPIDPKKILEFDKESAKYQNVKLSKHNFLDRSKTIPGEASQLLIDAIDFHTKIELKKQEENKNYKRDFNKDNLRKVGLEHAPPCIIAILNGLEDGKKRALFILLNYFRNIGWSYEEIEKELHEWNKKNEKRGEMLKETIIQGALRHHSQQKEDILPPNCDNKAYYMDLQFCRPDGFCKSIKNPVNYSRKKDFLERLDKGEFKNKRPELTEEEKLRRRIEREKRKQFKEEVKRKLESGEFDDF